MAHDFNGNEKGLKALFSAYYRPLCSFANRFTSDKHDAEDIVAQVFLNLCKLNIEFEKEANAKAWLFISVRNYCLNHIRGNKRKRKYIKYIDNAELEQEWDEDSGNKQVEVEVLNKLYTAIEQLPEERKKIIKLFLAGYDSKEIATMLEISESTVRNQKSKGFKFLKQWALDNNLFMIFALLALLER